MKYKAVRGMEDILPRDIPLWQCLERKARREFDFYGFQEIRTPILEDTTIFVRSIGESTDIVKKEMYTFKDRKGRSMTLRPEGTAPIVRAYAEHSLDKSAPKIKRFYYIGPMFRSERPQKGRLRQFHQIGAEIIGNNSPYADAELILQLRNMLVEFNLEGFCIKLNSLGCKKDKEEFAGILRKFLQNKKNRLCDDCRERVSRNVLRVLDCKHQTCKLVVREAPNIADNLCHPCKDHFDKLKTALHKMHIDVKETKNLVRGLDYYTGCVFEVTHPALGGQDAIGAGGRYDNLIEDMGGPSTGAIGYALGIERIILALKETKVFPGPLTIYIATLGDEATSKGGLIAEHIRKVLGRDCGMKIRVIADNSSDSLKSQMKSADRMSARFVLILGEDELKVEKIILRDMLTKKQEEIPLHDITKELSLRLADKGKAVQTVEE